MSCPIDSSTLRKCRTRFDASSNGFLGNGQSVMGRIIPALIPLARASLTAFLETREAMP